MALIYPLYVPTYIEMAAIQLAMCCTELQSQGISFFPPENCIWHHSSGNYLLVCPKQTSEAARHLSILQVTGQKLNHHRLLTQLNSKESTEIIEQDKLKS